MKKSKHKIISLDDFINAGKQFSGGWGYWGHENRCPTTDHLIVKAANTLKLPFWILCSCSDSRSARHFMDVFYLNTKNLKDFKTLLINWEEDIKSWSREEQQAEHNRFVPQSIQYILED